MKINLKNMNNKYIVIIFIIVIFAIIGALIICNNKRANAFEITNIMITSTGSGRYLDDNSDEKWNLQLYQNNDIYVEFGLKESMKKSTQKDTQIKEAYINNINVVERPFKEGVIESYKLSGNQEGLFQYLPIDLIEDRMDIKVVEQNANTYNCEINKNGGQVAISIVNNNIKEHIYDKRNELAFDGTLFKESEITLDELKFKVTFDLNIVTDAGNKYVKTIELELPQGNILENGFELNKNVEILNKDFEYSK